MELDWRSSFLYYIKRYLSLTMRSFSLATAVAFAALVAAAPTSVNHVVHEKRSSTTNWAKLDRVHPTLKLPMRIGLTQSNLDKGHDLLMDVYVPQSSEASALYNRVYVVGFGKANSLSI